MKENTKGWGIGDLEGTHSIVRNVIGINKILVLAESVHGEEWRSKHL